MAAFPPRVPVHPAPFYEILALLALFVGLKVAVYGRRPAGWSSAIAMAGYAGQRFLIEFIRLNKRYLWGLRPSQWLCLAFLLASLAFLVWLWANNDTRRSLWR
jgi:prolipoprotein diacylglyceryltransferase